jgi:hypothetical protein
VMLRRAIIFGALIAVVRIPLSYTGAVWVTRYSDWRQVAGYSMILFGSLGGVDLWLVHSWVLPNAHPPDIQNWLFAVMVSILFTSAILGWIVALRRPRANTRT